MGGPKNKREGQRDKKKKRRREIATRVKTATLDRQKYLWEYTVYQVIMVKKRAGRPGPTIHRGSMDGRVDGWMSADAREALRGPRIPTFSFWLGAGWRTRGGKASGLKGLLFKSFQGQVNNDDNE